MPFADIFSRSAVTMKLRSTSPTNWTSETPSMSSISGMIRSCTSACTSTSGLSDTTPNWITGKASGSKRPTVGSSTAAGKFTPLRAFSIKRLGCGHIRAVLECGKDRNVAFGGPGLNGLQPISAGDSPLNRVRDVADNGLRVGGRIRRKYGDQWKLDLRGKVPPASSDRKSRRRPRQ